MLFNCSLTPSDSSVQVSSVLEDEADREDWLQIQSTQLCLQQAESTAELLYLGLGQGAAPAASVVSRNTYTRSSEC